MSQAEQTPEPCVDCNSLNQSPAVAGADPGKAVVQDDPLDIATFISPIPHPAPSIVIEFCDRVSDIGSA
jgi:hypothetical protein